MFSTALELPNAEQLTLCFFNRQGIGLYPKQTILKLSVRESIVLSRAVVKRSYYVPGYRHKMLWATHKQSYCFAIYTPVITP